MEYEYDEVMKKKQRAKVYLSNKYLKYVQFNE